MRVRWSTESRRDRRELIGFVEKEDVRTAFQLDERISAATSRLVDFPHSGRPGRISGTRELVILRTPYIAVYTIDDLGVRIARLIHGAQLWPEGEDD